MHTHIVVLRGLINTIRAEDIVFGHLTEIAITGVETADGSTIVKIDSNGQPYPSLEGKLNSWLNSLPNKNTDNALVWWNRTEEEDPYDA